MAVFYTLANKIQSQAQKPWNIPPFPNVQGYGPVIGNLKPLEPQPNVPPVRPLGGYEVSNRPKLPFGGAASQASTQQGGQQRTVSPGQAIEPSLQAPTPSKYGFSAGLFSKAAGAAPQQQNLPPTAGGAQGVTPWAALPYGRLSALLQKVPFLDLQGAQQAYEASPSSKTSYLQASPPFTQGESASGAGNSTVKWPFYFLSVMGKQTPAVTKTPWEQEDIWGLGSPGQRDALSELVYSKLRADLPEVHAHIEEQKKNVIDLLDQEKGKVINDTLARFASRGGLSPQMRDAIAMGIEAQYSAKKAAMAAELEQQRIANEMAYTEQLAKIAESQGNLALRDWAQQKQAWLQEQAFNLQNEIAGFQEKEAMVNDFLAMLWNMKQMGIGFSEGFKTIEQLLNNLYEMMYPPKPY